MHRVYFRINQNGKRKSIPSEVLLYDLPKNKLQKDHNKKYGMLIKKRFYDLETEFNYREFDMTHLLRLDYKLSDFIKVIRDEKFNQRMSISKYNALLKFIKEQFRNEPIMKQINVKWLCDFKTLFIKSNKLSQNTKKAYFELLKSILNQAEMRDYIRKSPALGVSNIRGVSIFKEFLTVEEIKLLLMTKCDNENVRNAFLFSCLTGVRACDLMKLKSSDINEWGVMKQFTIIQEKTKEKVIVPIPVIAFQFFGSFLGKKLFKLPSVGCRNKLIKTWMTKAGINKHVTFNCARHSFAMILATEGFSEYEIKKGLGHKTSGATDNYLHYNKTSLNQQKNFINFCFTETLPNCKNDIGMQSLYISTTNLKIV